MTLSFVSEINRWLVVRPAIGKVLQSLSMWLQQQHKRRDPSTLAVRRGYRLSGVPVLFTWASPDQLSQCVRPEQRARRAVKHKIMANITSCEHARKALIFLHIR
jgi:hypothetical protein